MRLKMEEMPLRLRNGTQLMKLLSLMKIALEHVAFRSKFVSCVDFVSTWSSRPSYVPLGHCDMMPNCNLSGMLQ